MVLTCNTKPLGATSTAFITNWTSPSSTVGISIDIADNRTDGRYAAVRLIAIGMNGSRSYSNWLKATGGYGDYKSWKGTSSNKTGLDHIQLEVATFKGKRMMSHCTDIA